MRVIIEKNNVKNYFRLMKHWDTESKKDLIIRLTQSINEKSENDHDFSSCFGAWDDERSADEIEHDASDSRSDDYYACEDSM